MLRCVPAIWNIRERKSKKKSKKERRKEREKETEKGKGKVGLKETEKMSISVQYSPAEVLRGKKSKNPRFD